MEQKKTAKKIIITAALGMILGLGLTSTPVQAADAAKAGAEIHSHGNTKIVAEKPIHHMFSHTLHFGQLDISCDTCHPDIFEKKRGAAMAKGDYTMKSFAEGNYCGVCHDGEMAFDANSQCATCHQAPETDMMYFNKPVKSVEFSHQGHIDMGLECEQCHNENGFQMRAGAAEEHPEKFTMQALYDGKYCGSCHNGDDAFASNTRCTVCHIGVKGFDRLHGGPATDHGHH